MTEVILSALISRLVSIDYLEIKQRTSKKKASQLAQVSRRFHSREKKQTKRENLSRLQAIKLKLISMKNRRLFPFKLENFFHEFREFTINITQRFGS